MNTRWLNSMHMATVCLILLMLSCCASVNSLRVEVEHPGATQGRPWTPAPVSKDVSRTFELSSLGEILSTIQVGRNVQIAKLQDRRREHNTRIDGLQDLLH